MNSMGTRSALVLAALVIIPGVVPEVFARSKPVDSSAMELKQFALSPNGKKLAAVLVRREESSGNRVLEVVNIQSPSDSKDMIKVRGEISDVHWLGCTRVVFVSGKNASELRELYISTGRIRTLLNAPGHILEYRFGPYEKRVALAFWMASHVSNWISEAVPVYKSVLSLAMAHRLRWRGSARVGYGIATIGTPTIQDMHVTKFDVATMRWLRNPTRAVALRQTTFRHVFEMSIINVKTNKTAISDDVVSEMSTMAGSPSGLVAVVAPAHPRKGWTQWFAQDHLIVIDKREHVHVVSAGAARVLNHIWWSGNNDIWAQIEYRAPRGGPWNERLEEVDWKQDKIVRMLSFPHGSLDHCQLDERRVTAVCYAETLTNSKELATVDLRSGRIAKIACPWNSVRVLDVSFRDITVQNSYGHRSTGYLGMPERPAFGFSEKRREVPLAIMLYGFDEKFAADGQWIKAYPVQKLVRAGIDVLLLNFPAIHDWRIGNASAARFEFLENPLSTVEAAPDAVRKSGVNVGRVMVLGWSMGGFIAAHAVARTCEFVAAEIGDPAAWNSTAYALGDEYWRTYSRDLFGGPPDERYIDNYLAFDPASGGRAPNGPILFEFVARHPVEGQYIQEFRGVGAYIEAFAYHYSVHWLNVAAEAAVSRRRNFSWALLNLVGPNAVSASKLAKLGLSIPPHSAYRCS